MPMSCCHYSYWPILIKSDNKKKINQKNKRRLKLKMKLAISTDKNEVSSHFGRAPEYTFITIKNDKIVKREILPNPGHTVGSIPQFIRQQGAKYIITGGMGHRAVDFFNQYGVEVIMGICGSIEDVVQKILSDSLEGGESLCSPGGDKGYGIEKITNS